MTVTIAILGPGTLGLSFARHAAQRGFEVRLAGRDPGHAEKNLLRAKSRWGKALEQPSNSEVTPISSKPLWMERITPCRDLGEALRGSEALLEAFPEDLTLKAAAWRRVEEQTSPDILRLTGTSSLSLRSIREAAEMRNWLLGFHLFVPVHRMRVVELAREAGTPDQLVERAAALSNALGLRMIPVQDQPGFAATRMALAQGLEAVRLLEQGVATAEDLDALMVLGYGHPVGPLELSDRIGLDLRLSIAEQLHRDTGDPRFEAPAILRAMVQQGHVGRRAGRGFFHWNAEGKRL